MADKNITKVHLLNVPLENDYKNTLYFTSIEKQQEYFESKIVKTFTNFSYQRKDDFIRVPEQFDKVQNANYVMYQNSAYSNKWFYAFITDIKYIDEGRTDIFIETDYIQTWFFDYTVKASFVEREHVSDDTIGKHTIPEGLETGDYIDQVVSADEIIEWRGFLAEQQVVLAVSENGLDVTYPNGQKKYNGVFSGLYYITFDSLSDCEAYIRAIQSNETEDIIYAAFLVPKALVKNTTYFKPDGHNFNMGYVPYSDGATEIKNVSLLDTKTLDKSYKPRNNKLLSFPYRYILVSNGAGSVKDYRYEHFRNSKNKCNFNIVGAISPGCSIKLFPGDDYLSSDSIPYTNYNYIESLDYAKLPTCGWTNDSYTNWLTQNAVNMPLGIIGSVGAIVGGAIAIGTGAGAMVGVGAIAGGVMGIAQQMAQKYEKSLAPITAKGGVNQGDLLYALRDGFIPYKKSIKEEFAKSIDGYMDMFGYQVNRIKVPNKAHRSRWWYTKTIDVNIDGAIPNKDMQVIKNCYNNGITFWRNADEIQNYALSNGIAITDGAITD